MAPRMLSHVSVGVSDLDRSVAFYVAALAPLGVVRVWRNERGAGYGPPGHDDQLAIFAVGSAACAAGIGSHIALVAERREAVEAFYLAALQQGGSDEGAAGLRPKYGPGYYAAFVRDPDGHKLEAVCHEA